MKWWWETKDHPLFSPDRAGWDPAPLPEEIDRIRMASADLLTERSVRKIVYNWIENWNDFIDPLLSGKIAQEKVDKITSFENMVDSIRTESSITLYRGLYGDFAQELLTAAREGHAFDRMAPQSFTWDRSVGENFIDENGCCLLTVTVPPGSPIFYVSALDLYTVKTDAESEKEFILPPGRITITTSPSQTDDVTTIDGVFMPLAWPPLLVS